MVPSTIGSPLAPLITSSVFILLKVLSPQTQMNCILITHSQVKLFIPDMLILSSCILGLFTVEKSGFLEPVTSSFSFAFPPRELIVMLYTGNDCFLVPLTVKMCLVSYLIGWRPSFLTASLDMKSLPEPVSRCTQTVSPCISTGTIGGSDSLSA